MSKLYLFAILSIALSQIYLAGCQVTEECLKGDANIYVNTGVETRFTNLLRRYNQTCSRDTKCSLDNIDPLSLIMKQNYGGLSTSLRNTCERRGTHKACILNTRVRIDSEFEGLKASVYILEKKKPVCVPNTCSDEQINIVDPKPGQCDPNLMDCVVEDYGLKCGNEERPVTNTGQCANDILPGTNFFNIQKGIKEVSILTDCALAFQSLQGDGGLNLQSSGLCEFSTGPVNVDLFTDFTGFDQDASYQNHAEFCRVVGGDICHMDMDLEVSIDGNFITDVAQDIFPLSEAADVTVSNSFTNFPRCIAPSCSKDDFQGLVLEHFNRLVFDDAPINCDDESVNCVFRIDDVRCPFFSDEPEITDTPTTTPTKTPTALPIAALSGEPSKYITLTPSFTITTGATDQPSTVLSLLPSEVVSSENEVTDSSTVMPVSSSLTPTSTTFVTFSEEPTPSPSKSFFSPPTEKILENESTITKISSGSGTIEVSMVLSTLSALCFFVFA